MRWRRFGRPDQAIRGSTIIQTTVQTTIQTIGSNDPTELAKFVRRHPRLTVLSGAGCSTASGIPDYRDEAGQWKHARPVQYADFIGSEAVRQRYWARSFVGWRRISEAAPNEAHYALARLESAGFIDTLITQNVDNLHRRAGSRNVVDLHGVLHVVRCLGCSSRTERSEFQAELEGRNAGWTAGAASTKPDGDAAVSSERSESFSVPDCRQCGGVLKPDVVFFGENVPRERVQTCLDSLHRSDALLVVGSSLMVYSGYRFALKANRANRPIAIINQGVTRADELATHRFSADCGELLAGAAGQLAA